MLPKENRKSTCNGKNNEKLTNEDIDVAAMKVKDFLRQETQRNCKTDRFIVL